MRAPFSPYHLFTRGLTREKPCFLFAPLACALFGTVLATAAGSAISYVDSDDLLKEVAPPLDVDKVQGMVCEDDWEDG